MTSHAIQPAAFAIALFDEVSAPLTAGTRRFVSAIVLELRHREAARALRKLDDRMLADIGLRRGDIHGAVRYGRDSLAGPAPGL